MFGFNPFSYAVGGLNLRIRSTARPDKRNRQTCPACGQKLVNTYLRNGEWKCRKCWEATGRES